MVNTQLTHDMGRNAYGFECYKDFVIAAKGKMLNFEETNYGREQSC